MTISGNKPPIPALIGKKRTPAPIAVPYKLNIHIVSFLDQGRASFDFFETKGEFLMIFIILIVIFYDLLGGD
ncbi:MAG: hypothetical protein HamCj_02800 [Candidatus Hamiltonella defensa (Ceratovacuna japonica)]